MQSTPTVSVRRYLEPPMMHDSERWTWGRVEQGQNAHCASQLTGLFTFGAPNCARKRGQEAQGNMAAAQASNSPNAVLLARLAVLVARLLPSMGFMRPVRSAYREMRQPATLAKPLGAATRATPPARKHAMCVTNEAPTSTRPLGSKAANASTTPSPVRR